MVPRRAPLAPWGGTQRGQRAPGSPTGTRPGDIGFSCSTPGAVSSSPHPPCTVSVSWCHRLPWRSFPSTNGYEIIPAPAPVPLLQEGREKKPSLRAAGGRKRPGSPTGCEKLETAARCPVAAGGSQGHGGERSGRSPGTAAPGHGATPSNAFAAAWEQPGDPPVPPLCAGTRVAALRSGLCWASSSLMSFWGGFPRAVCPPKESLSLFGVLIPQILRVLHSQFLRHPLLSPRSCPRCHPARRFLPRPCTYPFPTRNQ